MDSIKTFEEFLSTQSAHLPVFGFIFNLILAAILAYFLGLIYERFGSSLSNRKFFAKNFILLAATTTLVISIVKSSLALSLGLVGALSIVRFRAAIKEPEELAYLFLCIGIGLGIGADQAVVTTIAVSIISLIIWIKNFFSKTEENQNLLITVSNSSFQKIELEQIINILKQNCLNVSLRRFDSSKELFEASFIVEFEKFEHLQKAKSEIQRLGDLIKITFLDNKGVI